MEPVEDQGWHFCLRLHRDTYVRSPEDSPSEESSWRQLRDLVPEEGERRRRAKKGSADTCRRFS